MGEHRQRAVVGQKNIRTGGYKRGINIQQIQSVQLINSGTIPSVICMSGHDSSTRSVKMYRCFWRG